MAISLTSVDELIRARRTLQGGQRGAPSKLEDGSFEGKAINQACVVMLSAALQAYVEDVFVSCSEKAFGRILSESDRKEYRKTWGRWGNPSPQNIQLLFLRLGVIDVFDKLSWKNQSTESLKDNLEKINQVRNRIAHGSDIKIHNKEFRLTLSHISRWRNISNQFGSDEYGNRFESHALKKIQ